MTNKVWTDGPNKLMTVGELAKGAVFTFYGYDNVYMATDEYTDGPDAKEQRKCVMLKDGTIYNIRRDKDMLPLRKGQVVHIEQGA